MSDEELRRLERAAATGDPDARMRFIVARRRAGKDPLTIILVPFCQVVDQLAGRLEELSFEITTSIVGLGGFIDGVTSTIGSFPDIWVDLKSQFEILSTEAGSLTTAFTSTFSSTITGSGGGTVTFKGGESVTRDEYREMCQRSQAPFRRPPKRMGRGHAGGRRRKYRPQVR